ncbi:MAG TPA: gamma-glutamyltransferase [Oleiagrimonas sp.]|nr:gamma-glutamyltransferase [Oleiagrimonas sp.]
MAVATFGLFACSQPNGTPSKNADTATAATQAQPANTTSTSHKQFAHIPDATRKMLLQSKPVSGKHGMVASSQHYATEVGLKILKQGGNAIDAAVAIGYAEAVTNPCCGNIGGGGFMTIHLANGKNVFLNFREKAPLKATVDMFQNDKGKVVEGRSLYTYKGVGVPGTVMGLNAALEKYGTMSLEQVIQPAIDLARNGFILEKGDTDLLQSHTKQFAKYDNVADIFLKDNGKPYQPGDRLVQKDLAHSLELIKKNGTKAFYEGPIAKAIVKASDANGGLLSMKDFANYTVTWEKPVTCMYHGYKIVSAPPPSSGGTTMCMILKILQPYPLSEWGYGSVKYVHYLAEAERRAFANRNKYLGDPAFVDNPIDKLLSDANIKKLRSSIKPDKATPSSELDGVLGAPEGMHTTHYSVADDKGNAVAVTYTINYLFGIGQIAGDTGFFLNDEMDDFTAKPGVANGAGLVQGVVNRVEPGKRPLSSMTPTLVMKDGKPFMLTGSPGSATIISTTLETIINVVDFGMNVQQAVDAPRLHQQWLPQVVYVEPGLLTDQSKAKLESMGYTLKTRGIGDAESIVIDPETGIMYGANDERRSPAGSAAGY